MASRSRQSGDASADLGEVVRSADVVHAVVHADADALAAGGLVARVAAARGTPYQLSVVREPGRPTDRIRPGDSATTVVPVGLDAGASMAVDERPLSCTVHDALVAAELDPDPLLALSGVRSLGELPTGAVQAGLEARRVDRDPGLGVPTTDLADGLAHSTLVHAAFSADRDAAEELLAAEDADARTVASLVAIAATEDAPERAATAIETLLRPHRTPGGPTPTAEGLGDVLGVLARTDPGRAAALAAADATPTAAIDAWRDGAIPIHRAVASAELARYSGLVVTQLDADGWHVARLLRDYRSPESAVLAVGPETATLATTDADAAVVLGEATDAPVAGHTTLAQATVAGPDRDALVAAVREVLA